VTCAPARVAIEELLPMLDRPVVLIAVDWMLGDSAGVGLVLVDRWRTIATCASRLPEPDSAKAVLAIARARAGLWAPGVTVAIGWDAMERELAEVLVRTPARMDERICVGFRRAWRHARHGAELARDRHGILGSELIDLDPEPLDEQT
jgi:hypothetical protein